jgi:hypothetical protein
VNDNFAAGMSNNVVADIIQTATGCRTGSINLVADITAEVNGKTVVTNKKVPVQLAHNLSGPARINIFWEDVGIDYRSLGLYGSAQTDFQTFKSSRVGVLLVQDPFYLITVRYTLC